ncbi:hypothetical protein KDK77_09485 [bacterium]|nr:hypothetical protein [bacterium]MCP5462946.1 hypothetical protein [bacterium]
MNISQKQSIIFLLFFVCVVIPAGCGKKEPPQEEGKETIVQEPHLQPEEPSQSSVIEYEELDNEIAENFLPLFDFIYPKAFIVNQDKNLTEKGVYQTKEDGGEQSAVRSASVTLATADDVKQVLEYYRRKFPEKQFKLFNTGDELRTVTFIHVTDLDPVTNERLEVKVKVNTPYKNFNESVVDGQYNVIQQQIKQYTSMLKLQNAKRNTINEAEKKTIFFEKKIKELAVQAAALKNRSTLIAIDIQFLAYKPEQDDSALSPDNQ